MMMPDRNDDNDKDGSGDNNENNDKKDNKITTVITIKIAIINNNLAFNKNQMVINPRKK